MKKGLIFIVVFLIPFFIFLNANNLKAQEKCYTDWQQTGEEYFGNAPQAGTVLEETEFSKRVSNGNDKILIYARQAKDCPAPFKDVNGRLQINPSLSPRPACFTAWRDAVAFDRVGGSPDECYSLFNQYAGSRDPHAIKRYSRIDRASDGSCDLRYELREAMSCPLLNSLITLSASADRIQEQGKFTITWSSENYEGESPDMQCTLSGKEPEKGAFSEDTRNDSRTYDFVQRGIYNFKFSCTGVLDNSKSLDKGMVSKSAVVYVGDIPPAPKVTLKVEPASIKLGETAVLSWTGENAAVLSVNQGIGVVSSKGSINVSPSNTTRYTITGSGEFPELGLAVHSATLRVIFPPLSAPVPPAVENLPETPEPIAPPTLEEKTQQIDLRVNGQNGPLTMAVPATFNLSWNLDKYCLAYGSWLGVKTKAGQEQRTETKPGVYTYKIYCPGAGSDEVKVSVTGGAIGTANYIPLPIAEASASLDGKNFSRSIRVIRGTPTDVWLGAAYDVTGDKRASRDETGQWGNALSNGGRCDWNTDLNKGAPVFDGTFKNPKTPEDCTVRLGKLTFYDKPGVYTYGVLRLVQNDGKVSNTSYINIAVEEPPLPKGPPQIDLKINGLDSPVTLGAPAEYLVSWDVKNADTCTASGSWDGEKFPAGSQRFVSSEKKEFTYTLSCFGKLGKTTNSILLKVTELPICDFSALPTVLSSSAFERQSVLSWKCQFANKCLIDPGVDIGGETFGSVRVSPKTTTKYTLTCQNLEGNSSFDQIVEVK